MSPQDIARELLGEAPDWLVAEGAREGVPVGLTYAALVPRDREDWDQPAWERANGKAMEKILEDAAEDPEWETVGPYLTVRVLDEDGNLTPEGVAGAMAAASLVDYPILDHDILSELEMEGFDQDWGEVSADIERGFLDVWEPGSRRQLEVIDELPDDWEQQVFDRYRNRETESRTDDRGYGVVDRDLVAQILEELGYVADDED